MSKDNKQGSKQNKPIFNENSINNSNQINEKFLALLKELLDSGISPDIIKKEFDRAYEQLSKKEERTVPLIFSKDLSVFESVVKYLKENKNLKFFEIAKLLSRDQREIWITYHRAIKKKPEIISPNFKLKIPLNIFSDRRFSPLECIVSYLRDSENLSFSEIRILLDKSYTTIHTSYSRFKKKIKKQNGK